jgi:hypothetical protein
MTGINRHGLVRRSGSGFTSAREDFPMLAKETPPLAGGRAIKDDLAACDRKWGIAPCSLPPRPARPPSLPDFARPLVKVTYRARGAFSALTDPARFRYRTGARVFDLRPRPKPARERRFFERAVAAIEAAFGIARSDLLSPRRKRRFARARFALFLLLRDATNWSLPKIGGFIGRDHTTIMHGLRQAEALFEGDEAYAQAYRRAARMAGVEGEP